MNTTVKIPELLEEIFVLAERGEFVLSPLTDHLNTERGDMVIGEMTPFEKAVSMVLSRLVNEHNDLVKEAHEKGDEEIDSAKFERLSWAWNACYALLWASVYDRVDAEYVGEKWESFTLLEGGQIAAIPNREAEIIERLVEGFVSVAGRRMELNCEECPDYDTCDMSIKKPR